jgi:predicted phosphodiesterase
MDLHALIEEYSAKYPDATHTDIASMLLGKYEEIDYSARHLRRLVSAHRNGGSVPSLEVPSGSVVYSYKGHEPIDTLEKAVKHFEVDLKKWRIDRYTCNSWDAPTKDGTVTHYQVKLNLVEKEQEVDVTAIKRQLQKTVDGFQIYSTPGNNTAVIVISDLHIGAQVDAIGNTPAFSTIDVVQRLQEVATLVNQKEYESVSVFMLGDFIESFTGMNHEGSWKHMERHGYGVDVVIAAYTILRRFLTSLNNVDRVCMVSGNHDRTSFKMSGDEFGSVAGLLAFMLKENTPLRIEHNPLILGVEVDSIYYLLTHNHYNIAKNDIGKVFWEYGKQGMYNMLLGGHWHARKGKRAYKVVEEKLVDQANYRQLAVAPLFTGNFYSESNGWNSSPGFTVIQNNGKGKPNVHEFVL